MITPGCRARHRRDVTCFATLALLVLCVPPVRAEVDARLAGRLDREVASTVAALIDQARERGLPTEPLIARALEGASRQAAGPRIVAAVRTLAAVLEAARDALGAASTEAELVAGAAALSSGVRGETLTSLRSARKGTSLVVPLVVLTDLVTRHVPPEMASAAVVAASRARVRDRDLMRLRERIGQDIQAGASPGGATLQRTRSLIGSFQPHNTTGPASGLERKARP